MAENENQELHLLHDFPAITTQVWKDKIIADLKGADFDKKLVWRTSEGFNVQPFYRQEDLEGLTTTQSAPGQYPFVRGIKAEDNSWLVRQNIDAHDAKAANEKALDVLNKGVNSLGFKLDKKLLSAEYIATLLAGIMPEAVELNFQVCIRRSAELVSLLADFFKQTGHDAAALKGSINFDPMSRMMLKGKRLDRQTVSELAKAMTEAQKLLPGFRVIGVNSVLLCNAGATCTQELGYALAWGNQYMEMLTEAGVDAATAAKSIKFNMGVQGNYFMEIAKFRAARMLWAMIVRQYEPECNCGDTCECEKVDGKYCPCAMKMHICAETSTFNMTVFDAYVNMLRSQTEAMSATLGGVESLVVTPFDVTYKQPDDFSERIARNQQLLLQEEAHFNKVVDPAAGSYYLENLTQNVAEQAWKLFLNVQEQGGFFGLIENGTIQKTMRDNLASRLKDVARRKETLLGTNQFPNFTETTDGKIQNTQKCGCGCKEEDGLDTIPQVRAAEQFEQLRLATEASAHRPKAFMLTIGNLAMRLARSQFSCNFFACAGYQVIDNNGFKTVQDGIEAARKAEADIIVLCSSDDEYAQYAPEAWELLKDSKEIFVVAGAPACMEDLQKLGIEHFVHVRVNVLEELQKYNEKLLK